MRLGYFAMPLHPPGAGPAQTMEDDLEQLAIGSGGFPGDFEMSGVDPKSGEQRELTRGGRGRPGSAP